MGSVQVHDSDYVSVYDYVQVHVQVHVQAMPKRPQSQH